jgi:hypothetical protein
MAALSPDTEIFRDLEEGLWRQGTRTDREWLDGVLAPDFTEFCRFGHEYDRNHILNAPVQDIEVEFPFDDFNVEVLAPGVVMVTYMNTVTYQGSTQSARRSSIWVETSSGWKLKFQQATTSAE